MKSGLVWSEIARAEQSSEKRACVGMCEITVVYSMYEGCGKTQSGDMAWGRTVT